jgi:hypothetical protein
LFATSDYRRIRGPDQPVRKSITSSTTSSSSSCPLARDASIELASVHAAQPLGRLLGRKSCPDVLGDRHRHVIGGHASPSWRLRTLLLFETDRTGARVLCARRLGVASLVDDEPPEAPRRADRAEVLEVEGENRSSHPLRDRHHASVDETEVEIGEARVDRNRTPQERGRKKRDGVLARGERVEKETRGAVTGGARTNGWRPYKFAWEETPKDETGEFRRTSLPRWV